MIYKIEQWDKESNYWYEVGECMVASSAVQLCEELKKENKDLFFRIVAVLKIV